MKETASMLRNAPVRLMVWLFLACVFVLTGCHQDSLDDLEAYLNATIPDDAVNLVYDFKLGRLFYIELSFQAPPQSAERFARAICDGELHQGYDPFDAVHTAQPVRNAIFVGEEPQLSYTFYSYSPTLNPAMWGNLCVGSSGGFYLIALDTSNPDLYSVKLEVPNACNTASVELACLPAGRNYIYPAPDFPLMAAGVNQIDGINVLVTDTLCVEAGIDYINHPTQFDDLVGTVVEMSVDQQPVFERVISPAFTLIDPTTEDPTVYTPRFDNCIQQTWGEGVHTMTFTVTIPDGAVDTYSIEFVVDDELLIDPAIFHNYIFPVPDFPLMVGGINHANGVNVLVADMLCVESRLEYFIRSELHPDYIILPARFDDIIGSIIETSIDQQPVFTRMVSSKLTLIDPATADAGLYPPLAVNCVKQTWEAGIHTMTLVITTPDGEVNTYSIEFVVDEDAHIESTPA